LIKVRGLFYEMVLRAGYNLLSNQGFREALQKQ